jgi:4-amino-4-deoxy-L-arabinose transferase-like glycosyltransferase
MLMADAEADGRLRPAPAPRFGLLLGLVLLVLTLARLAALLAARTDLFYDEAQYWTWAQSLDFGYFSKPPLIAWAIRGSTDVCGQGEACVRASAPLFYAGAAWFLYLAARALYDARIAFFAALIFATLPGVSFSSGIISTDVPLLFFWSAALTFGIWLIDQRRWRWALLCGLAIGFGALSKYAMLYFYLCAAVWFAVEPKARWLLRDWRGAALLAIPLLMLAPNVVWNLNHGLVTFSHTAANADLKGSPFHPLNMLQFLIAQFGVFGPVAFPMLLWIGIRSIRGRASPENGMLLSFSLPVVALMTLLAILSRAHANWAATAYPAATILVVATMLQRRRQVLLAVTLAVNLIVLAALLVAPALAGRAVLPGRGDPFSRMLGWDATAALVRHTLATGHYGTVLTDDRGMTAELLYYLRDSTVPIEAWRAGPRPMDHYQLTRPFKPQAKQPILLVTLRRSPAAITGRFASATRVAAVSIPAGAGSTRTVFLYALAGFKGAADGR